MSKTKGTFNQSQNRVRGRQEYGATKVYGRAKTDKIEDKNTVQQKNTTTQNISATSMYAPELIMEGRVDSTSKGFGFFVPDNGSEDLFVPARDMGGAMHTDRVRAVLASKNRGAGEAKIIEIISRTLKNIVGVFQSGSSGGGFVVPDDIHIATDIHVSGDKALKAKNNEKVVVNIIDYPVNRKPEGQITEVLGSPEGVGVDILSIVRAYNLYETFPRAVLEEAAKTPTFVSASEIAGRVDYREEQIITIDGDDSKDFDDAVTVVKNADGSYKLGVHIADVAHYVTPNSKLNAEALKRATSVYFVDRVLPMLPVELSNGICSLNEGEDRLALSVVMQISSDGHIIKHSINNGVINSKARMTYSNVAKILDGDETLIAKYSAFVPMLKNMKELAEMLKQRRTERGNIEFDLPESKIELDEKGKVVRISRYPLLISNKIIEEFMLATNETVAEHFCGLKSPFVYRAHPVPPPEKLETLVNFLSALGISFKGKVNEPIPKDFARLLETVEPKYAQVVNKIALRSMTKAVYSPNNVGHFGLAAPFYCHFTSPIRRYPDLMIHRIIKDYLANGISVFKKYETIVDEVSKVSSERERLAEQAERKVDDLKKAEFMSGKIGEKFDGVISGVTEWGVFVELENSCEGLVRAENLPGGEYVYNPGLMRLDCSTNSYKLGDKINIVVTSVQGDKVNFALDTTAQTLGDGAL